MKLALEFLTYLPLIQPRLMLVVPVSQYRAVVFGSSSSSGLAVPNDESLSVMLEKHPQCPLSHLRPSISVSPSPLFGSPQSPPSPSSLPPALPSSLLPSSSQAPPPSLSLPSSPSTLSALPSSPPPLLSLSPGVVSKAVLSFPPDTAPSPTGLRATHLKDGIRCPSPLSANNLRWLTQFTSLLSSGSAPQFVAPHLCGASLLASKKKSGRLRPIAIGEVFRRLTSKCLSSLVLPQIKSILPPHQVGVGSPNGAESIVHSVKLNFL